MSESKTKEATYKPTSPNSKLDFASLWEYDAAPESSANLDIKDKYDLFIGGKFQKPSKGRYFTSVNPSSEEEVTQFAEATQKDVEKCC